MAYLPPNCFLVSVIDPEGPTSSELFEPVISTSFASLINETNPKKNITKHKKDYTSDTIMMDLIKSAF